MEMTLKRGRPVGNHTPGILTIGKDQYYTLEDLVRDKKIPGETAIPAGRYEVIINRSTRFKKELPRLLNVPNFEGVLIHSGNTEKDTEGCILPGMDRNEKGVLRSREAMNFIQPVIQAALNKGEKVWLTVS